MSKLGVAVIKGVSMAAYIGTKLVNAKPMTRQEYNDFRGWELPKDEDGSDKGYLVEYIDGGKANTAEYVGYVSWSPADVFERAYHQVNQSAEIQSAVIHEDNNGVTVHHLTRIDEHELAAGHNYDISLPNVNPPENLIAIRFQNGPVKEVGVNGITNEALLAVIVHRLQELNKQFPCRENSLAITNIEQGLMWLEQRTKNRVARGVEGLNQA